MPRMHQTNLSRLRPARRRSEGLGSQKRLVRRHAHRGRNYRHLLLLSGSRVEAEIMREHPVRVGIDAVRGSVTASAPRRAGHDVVECNGGSLGWTAIPGNEPVIVE